jgi:pyruvate formate lyase activating enzyme
MEMHRFVQREVPENSGVIFDIKRFATDDGPGIRTTVFLKGCPLDCLWCHSPESKSYEPELLFVEKKCVGCRSCESVCSEGVHSFFDQEHLLNRKRCIQCGRCVEACLQEAIEIKGKRVTVEEVVDEVRKDIPFFRNTGGGVTFSGGEPTTQPSFLINLLESCKEEGIHTAIETCGFVEWPILSRILEYVDLFLFDLKHIDPNRHRKLTGQSNDLILHNLERLLQQYKPIEIRVPLIPKINDSDQHLIQLFSYVHSIGLRSVTLLPFNEAAGSKYSWCGKRFALNRSKTQPEERLRKMVELGARAQVSVRVQL